AAGIITLLTAAPTREQIGGATTCIAAAVLAAFAAAPFGGVTSLTGGLTNRERDGAIVLALLALITAAAAGVQAWQAKHEQPGTLRLPRRAPWLALALIC